MHARVASGKVARGSGVCIYFAFWKNLPVIVPHFCRATGPRVPPHLPVRAMGECSGAAAAIGWDLAQGYLFPPVNVDGSRGAGTLKAAHMTASLQAYLRRADVPPPDTSTLYTMPSFRMGGAVSRLLASTTVADIMSLVGCKCAGVGGSEVYRGYSTPPRREEEAGE